MDLVTGIVIYSIIWWLVLFCVLPFGVHYSPDPVVGHVTSAPVKPRLRIKFLVTSGISAIIFIVVFFLMKADVIDFRLLAAAMAQKDVSK